MMQQQRGGRGSSSNVRKAIAGSSSSNSQKKKKISTAAPPQLSKTISFCLEDVQHNLLWYKNKVIYKDEYKEITEDDIQQVDQHKLIHSANKINPYSNEKLSTFATYAALGSSLYCIGDRICQNLPPENNQNPHHVHCVDLRDDQANYSWAQVALMKNRREVPHVLVLDGKIFLIAGTADNDGGPWAEFYDPHRNRWKSLIEPPSEIEDHELVSVAFANSKRILVSGSESGIQYVYDLGKKSWENFGQLIDTKNLITGPESWYKLSINTLIQLN